MKCISEQPHNSSNNNALQKLPNELPAIQKLQNKFPTFREFSTRYNPSIWEGCSRQPTRCISSDAPTLFDVNAAYGDGCSIAWLMAQLTAFQEKLNVQHKMTSYEIETCAQTIFDHYHHLKTSEIMLFLARLLGGMYPVDWYGYVTPTKIITSLREHFMPWRNDLLYKVDKQEKERKAKEEAAKPTCTWQEFLEERGEEYRDSPIDRLINGAK